MFLQGSIPGLEAADTQYMVNSDSTVAVQTNTTRVMLPGGTQIKDEFGTLQTLTQDTPILVNDGTPAKLSDGSAITLPGSLLPTDWGKMQVTVTPPGSGTRLLTSGDTITLTAVSGVPMTLTDGSPISLAADSLAFYLSAEPKPALYEDFFAQYQPDTSHIHQPDPVKELEFEASGAYSPFNWELFYHIPIYIGLHLSKNGRYQEAQRWLNYILDPSDNSSGPTPQRFWKVKPFQETAVHTITEILINLTTKQDAQLWQDTVKSMEAWRSDPFNPFKIARTRPAAFMYKAAMAYLDNIIDWGDNLFAQYTTDSILEATQIYMMGANLLGPRPQVVPRAGTPPIQTFASLSGNLDDFSNAMIEVETEIPFDTAPMPAAAAQPGQAAQSSTLAGLGQAFYFCIPGNDHLLSYWDTIADRLFKIHNSLNLQGAFQQAPLFEPPNDPALLARAAVAGVDVAAVTSGLNQPLPLVRFTFLVQKATEICQEVKSLSSGLLAAMEKGDNEALAALRATHEQIILSISETVKYQQWQEAIKTREGLEKSLATAQQRLNYYQRLQGIPASAIPSAQLTPLDTNGLETFNFNSAEPVIVSAPIPIDIATNVTGPASGKQISSYEAQELSTMNSSQLVQDAATLNETIGAVLNIIPNFSGNIEPIGMGASISFGGSNLGGMFSATTDVMHGAASQLSFEANQTGKIGGYDRRLQEWAFQSSMAAAEINQIVKQLRAAQIRESLAEREWHNHQTQIQQANEIVQFLTDEKNGKETNQGFYAWMKREVKGLYGKCFQFAFDLTKKAERAMQYELGDPSLSYIQYGYLAGKEGLLAGEKLYLDIRRMEMDYHDLNLREYELTKHISMLQLDPQALIELRSSGKCRFSLAEPLFDMDVPAIFRRTRDVAISIPSVTGPYTGVNCKLTLTRSSIRKNANPQPAYPRGDNDPRFDDYFGSIQAIVTSSGLNDSGRHQARPGQPDERYLPFEGTGAISDWTLELTNPVPLFDLDTISDVIIYLSYTAREGGEALNSAAVKNLQDAIAKGQAYGSVRLFPIRHEFPTEWAKFKSVAPVDDAHPAPLTLTLRPEHYPYWSHPQPDAIQAAEVYACGSSDIHIFDQNNNQDTLTQNSTLGKGMLNGALKNIHLPSPLGSFTLSFSDNTITELWLALTWNKTI